IRDFHVTGVQTCALPISWVENTHYRTLDNPVRTASDEGVEVAEVFWYGCPHCYTFKPLIESWADQAPDYVNFVKLPAALGQSWRSEERRGGKEGRSRRGA